MDAQMNGILEEINERLTQEWSVDEVEDSLLESFFSDMVAEMVEEHGIDEEDAQEAAKRAAVSMIRAGELSPLPAEDEVAEEQVEWIEEALEAGLFQEALDLFE